MTALPTTVAMVDAAQDAYDVACADEAAAYARHETEGSDESFAKWHVTHAARGYARAVLMATYEDAGREALAS